MWNKNARRCNMLPASSKLMPNLLWQPALVVGGTSAVVRQYYFDVQTSITWPAVLSASMQTLAATRV
jgi:hypothetical protein